MKIKTKLENQGQSFTMELIGDFCFHDVDDFKEACDNEAQYSSVTIDMRNVSTIDSSALGALLNFKRQKGCADQAIKIQNCNPIVKKIFQVSGFNKLFSVE